MAKIPTVRERYEEKFGWAGSSGTFTGIRDEEIVKFIIAEREAGAREERERVHKFARKDFHSDFVENGLATRFYQALTPPTK